MFDPTNVVNFFPLPWLCESASGIISWTSLLIFGRSHGQIISPLTSLSLPLYSLHPKHRHMDPPPPVYVTAYFTSPISTNQSGWNPPPRNLPELS